MQAQLAQEQAKLQQELNRAESKLQQVDQTASQQLQDIQNKKQRVTTQTDTRQSATEAEARRNSVAALTVSRPGSGLEVSPQKPNTTKPCTHAKSTGDSPVDSTWRCNIYFFIIDP